MTTPEITKTDKGYVIRISVPIQIDRDSNDVVYIELNNKVWSYDYTLLWLSRDLYKYLETKYKDDDDKIEEVCKRIPMQQVDGKFDEFIISPNKIFTITIEGDKVTVEESYELPD